MIYINSKYIYNKLHRLMIKKVLNALTSRAYVEIIIKDGNTCN